MAALGIALAVVSGLSTVASASAQKRAAREQRRIQRLQERRERSKLFGEQRRATAEAQAQLLARGASASSAAETVTGSIATQGAAQIGFLNQAGDISRSMNAALGQAQTFQTIGQIAGTLQSVNTAGGFDKKVETPTVTPQGTN